jgi:GMP synthase (glutamine-hydrolysing)
MKIALIEHAHHEGPGIISDWIYQNNHILTICRPYLGELDFNDDFDFLILMGGPQSPIKIANYPYLKNEIKLAQFAIFKKKPILGICLGSQIIAEAIGIKTQLSPEKEYGIFPVEFLEGKKDVKLFYDFPNSFDAFHWHNDMPGNSEKITLLAKSKGCPHQAFLYNEKILGLQFHLEIRNKDLDNLFIADKKVFELNDKYILQQEEIKNYDFLAMNNLMIKILERLTG